MHQVYDELLQERAGPGCSIALELLRASDTCHPDCISGRTTSSDFRRAQKIHLIRASTADDSRRAHAHVSTFTVRLAIGAAPPPLPAPNAASTTAPAASKTSLKTSDRCSTLLISALNASSSNGYMLLHFPQRTRPIQRRLHAHRIGGPSPRRIPAVAMAAAAGRSGRA
jgi:hypothetical protein